MKEIKATKVTFQDIGTGRLVEANFKEKEDGFLYVDFNFGSGGLVSHDGFYVDLLEMLCDSLGLIDNGEITNVNHL